MIYTPHKYTYSKYNLEQYNTECNWMKHLQPQSYCKIWNNNFYLLVTLCEPMSFGLKTPPDHRHPCALAKCNVKTHNAALTVPGFAISTRNRGQGCGERWPLRCSWLLSQHLSADLLLSCCHSWLLSFLEIASCDWHWAAVLSFPKRFCGPARCEQVAKMQPLKYCTESSAVLRWWAVLRKTWIFKQFWTTCGLQSSPNRRCHMASNIVQSFHLITSK